MSAGASHEQLWSIVIRDERYDQALRGELDELAWERQCFSCACYHELAGERGYDWGVCFNPVSPRHGLLTFEHYGCRAWEPPRASQNSRGGGDG